MIYLNNAATTYPKPQIVYQKVDEFIRSHPYNLSRSGIEKSGENPINSARKNIAKLLKAENENSICFTSGATEALNTAIYGIAEKDIHIIATDQDHNASIRPLSTLHRNGIIELDFAPCDSTGLVDPNEISKLIKSNSKAIVLNHVSNVTGTIQYAEEIGKIAKDNNLFFILDASQSIGCFDLDVDKLNADFLAFTGHKSLYGLQGIGGFYISNSNSLPAFKQGGTGSKSDYPFQPDDMPTKFEAGTQNLSGIVSLMAGTNWIIQNGLDNISKRKKELFLKIINEFDNLKYFILIHNNERNSNQVICLDLPGIDPLDIHFILEESYEIQLRAGLHCAPRIHKHLGTPNGTLRAGISYFNTDEEIDTFIEAIISIDSQYGKF